MAAAAAISSSGAQKNCFNSNCKAALERVNKGWRRRTGEFAELCDRCVSAYEGGNFCETFHLNSSGWRCCETCGKQVHCGCIVSFHMFVLLDAGGIECITCARKSFILTPNPAWPPPSLFVPVQPERIKDISARNWLAIAGSGPVPWRQAPSVFNGTSLQSELQSRMPPIEVDRHRFIERLSSPPLEKRKMEESFDRLMNGSLKISCSGVIGGGGTPVANNVEPPTSFFNHIQQTVNSMTSGSTSPLVCTSKAEIDNHLMVGGTNTIVPTVLYPQAEKQSCCQNQADVSEAQSCNGKAKEDVRGRGQLLPRYWPRISEEELQKISEHSNSVITPLFEKMLSASDAGRIGRLVLPKKCAEAYFPPISHPEGVPLKIQDLKGKEWVFQFRFWPNNNSRMYVLEGIMPCIQSMQLQAGDIVTFSRIEPEGKLVMGCRKALSTSSDKGNKTCALKSSLIVEGMDKGKKVDELGPTVQQGKASSSSPSLHLPNQQTVELASTVYEADKHGVVGKSNSSARGRRKNSTTDGLNRKRQRIDSEDAFELKVSWEQVQELFRPALNKVPSVCVIEGCEFEEFEEAVLLIGRPTIPEPDLHGKKMQWVQCEKCIKWRKVPADALLKSQWTCSDNLWDPPRSGCSADEEFTAEKLEALLTTTSNGVCEKKKDPTPDPETLEALKGLDALADLAINEKASTSSPSQQPPASSKHPRHKPGCSCIVCIQPPSGKGPKHKQPCECVVCKSVKRRFETLMLKREQKLLSDKEPLETERQTDGQPPVSPLKGEIDLNMQPDKEEDRSASAITNHKMSENSSIINHKMSENSDSAGKSTSAEEDTKEKHEKQLTMSEYVNNNYNNADGIRHNSNDISIKNHIYSPNGVMYGFSKTV